MMTPEEYFDTCLLIEYAQGARITDFGMPMNCYGFVYWFYKLCLGKDMPIGIKESFAEVNGEIEYIAVDTPANGDVVNLRTTDGVYSTHVGIVYNDYIYHFTHSGLVSKNRFRMLNWIKGYYRVV